MLDERIEAAPLALVGEMHVGHVIRNGFPLPGRREHLAGRDINELGLRIDEPRDEPWAGDAVDLRSLPRHPARRRVNRLPVERTLCGFPALLQAAFEIAGFDSRPSQRGCRVLA